MSLGHGASIVRDGLVLHLDAANSKSYPGSGTTWSDLSGNGNNGTLVNGVLYDNGNNGSLIFDGSNDYARINSFGADSNLALSVFCWVYPIDLTATQFDGVYLNWIINKRNTTNPNSNSWQLLCGNSVPQVQMWDSSNNSLLDANDQRLNSQISLDLNNWYHVGFSTTGTSGGNFSLYVNGNLNYSNTLSGNRGIGIKPIDIGKTGWASGHYWDGKISDTLIYNKALTAAEVGQNFESTRSRYGI